MGWGDHSDGHEGWSSSGGTARRWPKGGSRRCSSHRSASPGSSRWRSRPWPWPRPVGGGREASNRIRGVSYSSYLLHFPLQLAFVLVIPAASTESAAYDFPWALLAFFAIWFPLSVASYRCFERPAQSVLRRALLDGRSSLSRQRPVKGGQKVWRSRNRRGATLSGRPSQCTMTPASTSPAKLPGRSPAWLPRNSTRRGDPKDRRLQGLQADRLGQVLGEACLQAHFHVLLRTVAAHGDRSHLCPAQFADQF